MQAGTKSSECCSCSFWKKNTKVVPLQTVPGIPRTVANVVPSDDEAKAEVKKAISEDAKPVGGAVTDVTATKVLTGKASRILKSSRTIYDLNRAASTLSQAPLQEAIEVDDLRNQIAQKQEILAKLNIPPPTGNNSPTSSSPTLLQPTIAFRTP